MSDHLPDCDTNDINAEGIRKPCNCGAQSELRASLGSVYHSKDFRFYETQPIHRETFLWMDATPDEDYPLRILRAYLESTYVRTESNPPQLGEAMNQAQDERAAILRRAIAKLTYSPNVPDQTSGKK